jgi:iron complex transport system ATP-binding protein
LIGKNGCGKTTLMKSIVNQIEYNGNCFLEGENLKRLSVKVLARQISYIPQRTGIGISLPVIDMVLMGFNPVLKLLEHPSRKQIDLAKKALEAVGLPEVEEQDFQTLSEGQKQLVFLARTMIEHTKLLLLDEPDSALDFQNRYMILKELKKMVSQEEKAGLLCLHDPALALEFCDQLVLLRDGVCVGIICPKQDSLEVMEKALRKIYGNISLVACADKQNRKHLTLLWEDM